MKLIERDSQNGIVENAGLKVKVVLTFVPEAAVGDHLLVHAGYALTVINESDANETITTLRQLGVLDK